MPSAHHLRIEDYALIGNTNTAALVGRNGSIDWLCLPHFDSAACFAALLGKQENGRWLLAPHSECLKVTRRYRGDTLVLETEFETPEGTVAVLDFMPCNGDDDRMDLVRLVQGRSGNVPMRMDLVLRFDYGHITPWVQRIDGGISGIAGPDAIRLLTPAEVHGENYHTVSSFSVRAGETIPFTLTWYRSHRTAPAAIDVHEALTETERFFTEWAAKTTYAGPHRDAVVRSLLTLKALTFAPTGGIVAAPTTSLPEKIGGVRNWDYRYCWLRDATLTLYALLSSGYVDEARDWREWLLRTIAGNPSELQIMYGIAGERRLQEFELGWLAGYEESRPVRVGNAASTQLQLDVYGEVIDALFAARRFGLRARDEPWRVQKALLQYLEQHWQEPDEGIWEMRGGRRHYTHSKVMAWVAFDRAVKSVEHFGLDGPVDRWRMVRDQIHADVCAKGYDERLGTFVQAYGSPQLDAAVLLIPLVGFLPPEDPRVRSTVEAIERELRVDGLVLRYRSESDADGLPPGEGAFIACSFWLVDALAMLGRREEAEEMFEHLLALRNDVGLLAEEYDPRAGRQLGNFPQAFSHIGLINSAHALAPHREGAPSERTKTGEPHRASDKEERPAGTRSG